LFAAVRYVAIGTKRACRGGCLFVRFRSEADIGYRIVAIICAAFDPELT
jgi:hypothetical protein